MGVEPHAGETPWLASWAEFPARFSIDWTPHPGPLLVRGGEGEFFCGTISWRRKSRTRAPPPPLESWRQLLECGGQRSATPLSPARRMFKPRQSSVRLNRNHAEEASREGRKGREAKGEHEAIRLRESCAHRCMYPQRSEDKFLCALCGLRVRSSEFQLIVPPESGVATPALPPQSKTPPTFPIRVKKSWRLCSFAPLR